MELRVMFDVIGYPIRMYAKMFALLLIFTSIHLFYLVVHTLTKCMIHIVLLQYINRAQR